MGRTVVATYAYPDADGVHPASFTDLSAGSGQIQVTTNKYHNGFTGQASDSVITAGTYSNNQYCKSVVSGFTGAANGDQIGVSVRASTDTGAGRDMYRAYVTDNAPIVLTLEKVVNGTVTSLGTNSLLGWVNGDTVEVEAIGSTIWALRNGAIVITVTDTALTTGKPGIFALDGTSRVLRGDDTEMGNSALNQPDSRTQSVLGFTGVTKDQFEDDEDSEAISPWVLSGWYDIGLSLNRWYDEDFAAATTSDVTVALNGQAATFSAGTLVANLDRALTGQSATLTAGTLTATPTVALTGQSATFLPGTLTPSTDKALTGQAATFAVGTLTPNTTVALTGQQAVFNAGTVTASTASDVTVALTGQSATFTAGALTPSTDVALTGQRATFSPGTLTAINSLALVGQAANFAAGTLTPNTTIALTGISATFTPGTMTAQVAGDVTVALTGIQAVFTAGNLTASGGDTASTDQPSGGYGFFNDYEIEIRRRERRRKQREQDEEETRQLEDAISREIATLLHEQEAKDAERADLERLRQLVAQYRSSELPELSPRVLAAYARATAQQNFSAFQALQRELQRQMEEEEHVILLLLLED